MCRVALINPSNLVATGQEGENAVPPLGLAYIAAVLREHGFTADIFDLAERPAIGPQELEELGFLDYDLYGFTAYTKTFRGALPIIRLLATARPQATVLFGGPHATPCAQELLETYPEIDLVVRNEGELATLQIAQHLPYGAPRLEEIPALVYRAPDRGVVTNPDALELVALDDLPHPVADYRVSPSYHTVTYRRHREAARIHFMSSSRGCPKRCTFCSIIVMSPKFRFRSVESLMDEIRDRYEQEQFGHISFVDANFFVHVRRTLEFSRRLYEWNPGVTWAGTATADFVARHAEVLAEIGSLNCAQLELGIESGSPSVLRRFNKRTTVEQNLAAIELLEYAGIDLELDFIMFDPETTLDELRENWGFFVRADLLGYHPAEHLYNALKLYPGTPARDHYIERFNLKSEHLMRLVPPFVHEDVGRVYAIMSEFSKVYQQRIDAALDALAALLRVVQRHPERNLADPPRVAATAVRLRHAPYRFFAELLTQISSGALAEDVSLQDLRGLDSLVNARDVLASAGDLLPAARPTRAAI
jgi:radical SAM superfamily enzyme YgiQ (UPF0313 family)